MLSASLFAFLDSLWMNRLVARWKRLREDEWIASSNMSKQIGVGVNRLKLMLDIHQQGQRNLEQQLKFCAKFWNVAKTNFHQLNYFRESLRSPEPTRWTSRSTSFVNGIFCANSTMLKFHKTCRIQLPPILKNLFGLFLP